MRKARYNTSYSWHLTAAAPPLPVVPITRATGSRDGRRSVWGRPTAHRLPHLKSFMRSLSWVFFILITSSSYLCLHLHFIKVLRRRTSGNGGRQSDCWKLLAAKLHVGGTNKIVVKYWEWNSSACRQQNFYSQYDSRYVGCHWLRFAPFLCTNLIGQGPELLTTPASIKICRDCWVRQTECVASHSPRASRGENSCTMN